ncbi:ribosomal RNA small subunit methyltransferase E [Halobacillus andaensis]|uniref:Ribosomal RNA small subunit methyltransferase E n=1 Tax=Halobacillus andaensis TaxID=1176239 RepID=A0A917ESB7_HALAA|nr:16S rRNA (uracil(1498)-N(3))-methyltransferase [Halobacillus andaensis]MBP2003042.1 16S rRNA (uracil1498-N3)-methyltransferase [Halobacillus andaensis]GGF07557.1 ribosomal RNA small subunit methyltransferase E [Halobacillus andaensis]
MQRYFVESLNWDQSHVYINSDDVHHIVNVMRMVEGNKLICVHPNEGAAVCSILQIEGSEQVVCKIEEWITQDIELPVKVTVVQSLGKGDKVEQVVQKGTELGADSFIPFQADRSVAKWDAKKSDKKIHRLEKIAKEASEQSERTSIPSVKKLMKINEIVSLEGYDYKILAYEGEARNGYSETIKIIFGKVKPGDSIIVVFGPEGGFSDKEVETFLQSGFQSIRLGPRILRMETAPLYFLSALSYQLEE